jgi:carbon-monoxide dehydrogenase large subunit
MREFGVGQSIPRIEDQRLLSGRGRATDDMGLPRQAVLHVLRSPHAAARIRSIDIEAAKVAFGVLAVLTGADTAADGLGTFTSRVKRKQRDVGPNLDRRVHSARVDGMKSSSTARRRLDSPSR